MSSLTVGLKVDNTRRVYVPRMTFESLGEPSLAQVDYDEEAKALRLVVPPEKALTSYRVALSRNYKASIHVATYRKGNKYIPPVEMPSGRYEPVGGNIFVHESQLDPRPEAELARYMLEVNDFVSFFKANRSWRCLFSLRIITMPDGLICPTHGLLRRLEYGTGYGNQAKFECKRCHHSFYPTDGTLFPRTRAGVITWMYGLWYLVHHPDATYHDLEGTIISQRRVPPISHAVAVRMVQQLQEFLPRQNLVFNWTSYHNSVRSQDLMYVRINPKQFTLTAKAWLKLGEPKRVNLSVDPVEGLITVTPDPQGAHALNAKHVGRDYSRSSMIATVASIEDSTPLGIYEPISIGRLEGVFKLTRRHKRITDRRPNPETYVWKDRWLGMEPSRGALAQRARRLRELAELRAHPNTTGDK